MRKRALVTGCRPPRLFATSRKGHVNAPSRELALHFGIFQGLATRLDGGVDAFLGLIDLLAGRRPLRPRQGTQGLQLLGDRTFLTEPTDTNLIQGGEVAACSNLAVSLFDE